MHGEKEESLDLDSSLRPASESKYKLLFERSADAMLIIEGDKFVDCNQATLDMLGYADQEDLFSTHPSELSPEFQADGRPSFEKANENMSIALDRGSYRFEWTHTRANGDDFPVEVLLTSIPFEGKDLLHVVWRDISHRYKIEQEVIDQHNHLQEMSRLVNEQRSAELAEKALELDFQKRALDEHAIVSITDIKGNITYVNDKFCIISGFTREELINQNHRILRSGEHSPDFYQDLWQTISGGEVWQGDIKNSKKNGGFYWVTATIVPFLNDRGIPFQYVAIRTDITDRKQAEAMKSEFISTVSHELRTPLTSIKGALALVQSETIGQLPDGLKSMLSIAYNNSDRLAILIDDLLDMEKLEYGKMTFNLKPTELTPLIENAIESIKGYSEIYNVSFVSRGVDEGVIAHGDKDRLMQVLFNLMSNAAKFSTAGDEVEVSARRNGESVRIAVKDNGPGIAEEFRDSLFDKFTQGDASDTRQNGGSGLGLSIAREIVHRHGGEIAFESEQGVGSTFFFTVPLSD